MSQWRSKKSTPLDLSQPKERHNLKLWHIIEQKRRKKRIHSSAVISEMSTLTFHLRQIRGKSRTKSRIEEMWITKMVQVKRALWIAYQPWFKVISETDLVINQKTVPTGSQCRMRLRIISSHKWAPAIQTCSQWAITQIMRQIRTPTLMTSCQTVHL